MDGWPGMIDPLKMHGLCEVDDKEVGPRLFIPVAWASLQAIQGYYELEKRVWGVIRQYLGGCNTYVSPSENMIDKISV